MEAKRNKFQGVLNILSFNRHFYVVGLGILALLFIIKIIFDLNPTLFWIVFITFIYGLVVPLLVSAYVYDFSGYYNFDWLKSCKVPNAKNMVNINAGFDETSFILKKLFPKSDLKVFDFYNSKWHTEPAIRRARKVSEIYPGTQRISTSYIPLPDKSIDVIFLISSVHEIRSYTEKIKFLEECNRVCKPDGRVVMVEHLRDFPNFLAFSVGFTHFFSRKTWKEAFKNAGFSSYSETKFTPFMSIFNCNP